MLHMPGVLLLRVAVAEHKCFNRRSQVFVVYTRSYSPITTAITHDQLMLTLSALVRKTQLAVQNQRHSIIQVIQLTS